MHYKSSSSTSNAISFTLNGDAIDGRGFNLGDLGFPLNRPNESPRPVGGANAFLGGPENKLLSPNPLISSNLTQNPLASSSFQLLSNSHMVPQATRSNVVLGQLALNHRVTEIMQVVMTSRGVQFHSFVDVDFTRRQSELASLPDVVPSNTNPMPMSQFPGALSTREGMFLPETNMKQQYHPSIMNNWVESTSNPMNKHPSTHESQNPSRYHTYPSPLNHPIVPSLNDLMMGFENEILSDYADVKDLPSMMGAQPATLTEPNRSETSAIQTSEPWSNVQPKFGCLKEFEVGEGSTDSRSSKPSEPAVRFTCRKQARAAGSTIGSTSQQHPQQQREGVPPPVAAGLTIGSSSQQPPEQQRKRVPPVPLAEETTDSEETEDDESYDGRTHSLNRGKHGPYACPRCNAVFGYSQAFASHVQSSHYRNETIDERMKRLAAKYKKKGLKLVRSHYGVTIMPKSSLGPGSKTNKARDKKTYMGPKPGINIKEEEKREFLNKPIAATPIRIVPPPGMPYPPPPPNPEMPHSAAMASNPIVKAEVEN
ncbi:hypothetical protein CDL15_Pgr025422 [Punica granatum]|uniref:C2H2-type domain-containing protein n=2 Tax=Punica granatum TaxID=22663 RepID=A0A218W8W8_PUNGR|nr:hypothetical protein CDL15_Pgr025422 [Punica granatum]